MTLIILLALLALSMLGLALWTVWRSRWIEDISPRWRETIPWYAARGRRGLILLVLVSLVAIWLVAQGFGLLRDLRASPDLLIVRVAPFVTTAQDQRQGRIVARQLVDELKARVTTPMNLGMLDAQVTSPEQALEVASKQKLDILLWGSVAEGATASQASLRPQMLWLPDKPFVPYSAWQGYAEHFALPAAYDLALQPLNGPVVLAPLLDGMNHLSRGDADLAAVQLEALRHDYSDVLRPEVPAMIKASILWAQGLLSSAEAEARAALAAADRPEHWNNLGALLLDQQAYVPAEEALRRAISAAPVAEAHANLGRLLLELKRPGEASVEFHSAVQHAPHALPFLAELGKAYRHSGRLDEARQIMKTVREHDKHNVLALTEQALLALTDVPTATARLEWELERPPVRSLEELTTLRRQVEEGIARLEEQRAEYLRQANAYGVSGRPAMQRLAEHQADRLLQEALTHLSQLVLVQVEQGRVVAMQPRSLARRFWDSIRGRRTPLEQAIATVDAILKYEVAPSLRYDLLYQAGRAGYFGQTIRFARERWETAQQVAETIAAAGAARSWPEVHYGRAKLLLDEGDAVAARAELAAALAADERFFPAHDLLAALAEQERRWDDAQTHYRWLIEHRPWDAVGHIGLARVLHTQGDLAGAEAQLLPLANAGNVDALVALAAVYRRVGLLDQASDVLDRALARAPASPAVYEELAAQALARGEVQAAESALRQILVLEPQRSSAYLALGQLYAHLDQPEAAVEQFRAATRVNNDDIEAYRRLGEALLQSEQPDAAADAFQRAIALNPNSYEALHGLAQAYLALGHYDLAAEHEQHSLDLAGGAYAPALVGLGDIAYEQGRYDEAINYYNAALERDAQATGAYLGLGQVELAQGHSEAAIEHYRRGLAAEPQNLQLLLALGDAQLQINNVSGALSTYNQAKRLAPNNGKVYAGMGRALWQANQSDAALPELEKAVQLGSSDAETLLLVGDINAALARPDAALDAFGKAAAARPEWYEPRFRRGVLLLQLEQNAAAIDELEATVQLNPSFPQGLYWLGRAYRAADRPEDAVRQFQRALELQPEYHEARYFLGQTLGELGRSADAITAYEIIRDTASSNDRWRDEAVRELKRLR